MKAKYIYFFIYGPGAEILAISTSDDSTNLIPKLQRKKYSYLGTWTTNQKSKVTLLFLTLKVEENKSL